MSFISPMRTDSNGNPRETGSMQTLGKDDFLQLLVAKMQYQDPLDPVSDQDFIAQLAQFSTLEQMTNIADGIEASNQWDFMQMQSLNNNMAASLIGKEVRASYDGVYYDQISSPTINYMTSDYAKDITFTVRDVEGNIINTIKATDIQPGNGSVTWDGTNLAGNRVAEGYYTIEATGTLGDGSTFTPSLTLTGVVDAISYQNGAAFLNVNGTQIPLGDVTWIGQSAIATTDTSGNDIDNDNDNENDDDEGEGDTVGGTTDQGDDSDGGGSWDKFVNTDGVDSK